MRARALPLLPAALSLLLACDKASNPVAPTGTILTVTAVPTQIPISGGGATLTIIGIRPDGNSIHPGTQITLTTSLGVLRPVGVACSSTAVVAVVEANTQGQATAQLCSDGRTGEATVRAALTNATGGDMGSGSAEVRVQIGSTDADRPTVVISANPTIVAVGGESQIRLLGRNRDGSSVAAGQRIRLTADLGTLTCSGASRCPGEASSPCTAACTNSRGEAEATFVAGNRAGTAEVSAILGTSEETSVMITLNAAIDSLSLTADPQSVERLDAGDEVELEAILLDALGSPLSGVLVRFESEEGTLSQTAVPSNSQGIASTTLTVTRTDLQNIPANGTFEVTASATSEAQTRTDSVDIRVLGAP